MKLNKKILIVLCIILFLSNFIFINKVFSKNNCEVLFVESNSNPKREEEIEVVASIKDVNQPISGVFFTIDYDTTKLELKKPVEALNNWNLTEIEQSYYLYEPTYEETKDEQVICKFKFKVKSNASLGNTTVAFKKIQIAKSDASVEEINDVNIVLNIKQKDLTLKTEYSTEEPTNKNVVASILSEDVLQGIEGWTLSQDGKRLSKEYSSNIEETITVQDLVGNIGTANIKINNIDKIAPVLKVTYSTKNLTTEVITVNITSNEKIQEVSGWTSSENGLNLIKEYSRNAIEEVIVKDLAGNKTKVEITINNIVSLGDVSLNNRIDIGDILLVLRHLAQENSSSANNHPDWKLTNEKIKIGDVNKNERLDMGDVIKLLRYIAATNDEKTAKKHPDWLEF